MRHPLLGLLVLSLFLLAACRDKSSSVAPSTGPSYDETWRPKSSLSGAQAKASAEAAAYVIGAKVYAVAGTHSMEPVIWGNCFIIAEPVKVADIKPGDIVLWRRGSMIVLHTCVGNHGGRLTIKGYNNFSDDNQPNQFITQDDVVGRYVGHVTFDPTKP